MGAVCRCVKCRNHGLTNWSASSSTLCVYTVRVWSSETESSKVNLHRTVVFLDKDKAVVHGRDSLFLYCNNSLETYSKCADLIPFVSPFEFQVLE